MSLDKEYINLKFTELRYLLNMIHVVQNQLNVYALALSDVLTYVTAALSSYANVELALSASMSILYPQLFEELKTVL